MTDFLIRADQPFQGNAQSVLLEDGTVAWTEGLTVDEYERENGFKVRVVSDDDLTKMIHKFLDTLKTKPQPIPEQRFYDMLEVLPPCRWHSVGGYEVFHVSERITGNLVSWLAHKAGQYWEFTDSASLPSQSLAEMLRDAEAAKGLPFLKLG